MNQACDNLLALKALLRTIQEIAKICNAAEAADTTYELKAETQLDIIITDTR